MTAPERDHDELLPEALAFLTGEGRPRTAEGLLAGLHARFASAGRAKLADLVYEMTKARLAVFPDFAVRTQLAVAPRDSGTIRQDMDVMSRSLRGVAEAPDLSAVTGADPAAARALDDARRCLEVLATLEGESPRHQLALATTLVHQGDPAAAEGVLRALQAADDEDPVIRRCTLANLAFCLHRQDKSGEALELAQAALDEFPDRPALHFTIISSAADLADRACFEQGVARLFELQRRAPSPLIRAWISNDLERMARRTGLDDGAVAELLAAAPGEGDPG